MPHILRGPLHRSLLLVVALLCAVAPFSSAAVTVASIAPGSEDAAIAGFTVENFEDTVLQPGLSIVLSQWRDSNNNVTADGPVTFPGTLPAIWSPAVIGFASNAWDGTHTMVNGHSFTWTYPFAAQVEFNFATPRRAVGVGLSNFQHDLASGNTFHTLTVNGVSMGRLENLAGWTSGLVKNRYVLVTGDVNTPIQSILITADTHYDGMIFDKLATSDLPDPTLSTTWGRLKTLFR